MFVNNQIYHVFNRTIEKKPAFTDKKEYERAILSLSYYRFDGSSFLRLSKVLILNKEDRELFFNKLKSGNKMVRILSYCLMPNHFHLLLEQLSDQGIKKYLSNFSNSYTRYFNTKHKRIGALFQGIFKAVRIEDDEQLIHVSRYIHLNPITSCLVTEKNLDTYSWSSFPEFIDRRDGELCDTRRILDFFPSKKAYWNFIYNQIDYAKNLEQIKHLLFE